MILTISPDLSLRSDVVTQKVAYIGTTGSGKTYGCGKTVEEMIGAGAQVVILDPVGVWYGLRLAKDGKSPGIPVTVLGGLHGDIQLEPTSGKLIADLIVDTGASMILDVSQFESDKDKARFAADFADRFFFRKKSDPSAVHVVIEECQEFVPQNPQAGEERMLHAYVRMWKLGRNFGIGGSLLSQRPQEVNKKALNLSECLFAFQLQGKHERRAVEQWIEDKGLDLDIANDLPKLETGNCHVWSPRWLKISKTIRFGTKWTFDASKTPEVGKKAAKLKLAPVDLAQLQTRMAETIEKAKAEDPVLLNQRIRELERQLKLAQAAPAKREIIEVLTGADRKNLLAIYGAITELEKVTDNAAQAIYRFESNCHLKKLEGVVEKIRRGIDSGAVSPSQPTKVEPYSRNSEIVSFKGRTVESASNGSVSPVGQRILNALAEMELLKVTQPAREVVAMLAGYTHLASPGYAKAVSQLRTAGMVDYPSSDTISFTDEGRRAAIWPKSPRSSEEIQKRVCDLIGGKASLILGELIRAYPNHCDRMEVARVAGYGHLASPGFAKIVSRLRTLGFVEYPDSKTMKASKILFLNE